MEIGTTVILETHCSKKKREKRNTISCKSLLQRRWECSVKFVLPEAQKLNVCTDTVLSFFHYDISLYSQDKLIL